MSAAPLNLMNDVATLGKTELVVTPVVMAGGRVERVETVTEHLRIEELDEAVVVLATESNAN